MKHILGEYRSQRSLLPDGAGEYVGPVNPFRFICAFVDTSIWRRLELEAQRNLEVTWLLCRFRPDFKTISDFRRDKRYVFQDTVCSVLPTTQPVRTRVDRGGWNTVRRGIYSPQTVAVDTGHYLIAEQQVHGKVTDLGLLAETASATRENLAVYDGVHGTRTLTKVRIHSKSDRRISRPSSDCWFRGFITSMDDATREDMELSSPWPWPLSLPRAFLFLPACPGR